MGLGLQLLVSFQFFTCLKLDSLDFLYLCLVNHFELLFVLLDQLLTLLFQFLPLEPLLLLLLHLFFSLLGRLLLYKLLGLFPAFALLGLFLPQLFFLFSLLLIRFVFLLCFVLVLGFLFVLVVLWLLVLGVFQLSLHQFCIFEIPLYLFLVV